MKGPGKRRRGFTLVETLVALALGWLVAYLALTTLARQRALQGRLTARAEGLAAVRTIRHVLAEEVRVAAPVRDGWRSAPDSLDLRVFRGVALLCPGPREGGEVTVLVEGVRMPDPTKDSVLAVGPSGTGPALRLLERGASSAPCEGAATAAPPERWVLSGDPPDEAVILRFYERGSYHLSGRALRSRRGAGGRQPLTPEVVSDGATGFEPVPGGGLGVRLATLGAAGRAVGWPSLRLRPSEEPDAR